MPYWLTEHCRKSPKYQLECNMGRSLITLIYLYIVDKIYLKSSNNKESVNVEFFKLSSDLFNSDFIWGCPAVYNTIFHCQAADTIWRQLVKNITSCFYPLNMFRMHYQHMLQFQQLTMCKQETMALKGNWGWLLLRQRTMLGSRLALLTELGCLGWYKSPHGLSMHLVICYAGYI